MTSRRTVTGIAAGIAIVAAALVMAVVIGTVVFWFTAMLITAIGS